MFVTALTVLVGGFLLEFVIDGIYNDKFTDAFVRFFMIFSMDREQAIQIYRRIFWENKDFFMVLGFLSLFALFFYVALSKMTKYLDQIEHGVENIISDSSEPVRLITELKPLERRMNEIKATLKRQELEAIELENKKNDLIVFLAHDLKTPLTSVVAYLSMLETHPEMSKEERAKYTHISLEKANRLGELLNEFFEITKYNFQNGQLEKTELNVSMMLEQIADELYGVLMEKKLTCKVEAGENISVYGDPDKLARVFDNILKNAIAYCDPDTEIFIEAAEVEDGIQIIFTNKGNRIPQDKLSTIFEKFYRADTSRNSKTGGAGLGLAIAKEIVELHDGTIRAESDNERTRFIVVLPKEEKDEVHTHSRRAFGRKSKRRKSV